ncbi:MAG TPA: tail fiber domain-containing protein [Bacteroidales bacterium]|nr:tail fiber domain-containing protein [Bacteroidales bacterium]
MFKFKNLLGSGLSRLGSCNTVYTPSGISSWYAGDRLFVIGNGADTNSRSDAITVLKNGNTGVGTSTPSAQLHTTGTVRFQGAGTPGSGKILTSDGIGYATWQNPGTYMPSGITGQTLRHDGSTWLASSLLYNNGTSIGIGTSIPTALLQTFGIGTGGGNVLFVGSYKSSNPGAAPASGAGTRMMWYPDKAAFRAGYVAEAYWDTDSTGYFSVGFGSNNRAKGNYSTASGQWCTASGSHSVAMGYLTKALGSGSSAFGYISTASGTYSTAMGYYSTASGTHSTAMGYYSTASGNSSIAMGSNTSASGDASMAMGDNTVAYGKASTAMGYYTGASSYCETVIGACNTLYNPSSATSWNINDRLFVIGNGIGVGNENNAMTVMKNGNVGINTSAPLELLHVNNTNGASRIRVSANASYLSEVSFYGGINYKGAIGSNNNDDYIYIYQNGNIIFKNGRIGIQSVTNPTYAIELPNSGSIGTGSARAYAWATYSDKRLKSDVKEINYGIDAVLKLKPVSYLQHNSTVENGKIVIDNAGVSNIGFIAQDIYKIIPEIVIKPENDENTLWSMSYEKLTPVLVKAIQEQQKIIAGQDHKIEALQKQINDLKELINK